MKCNNSFYINTNKLVNDLTLDYSLSTLASELKVGFNELGERDRNWREYIQWWMLRWKPQHTSFREFYTKILEGYSYFSGVVDGYDVDDISKFSWNNWLDKNEARRELEKILALYGITRKEIPLKYRCTKNVTEKTKNRFKYKNLGLSPKLKKEYLDLKSTNIISYDIDNATMSMEDAIKCLNIKPHFAYTTVSNNDAKGKYKFRFIYIIDKSISAKCINYRKTWVNDEIEICDFDIIYRNLGLISGIFQNFIIDSSLANWTQYIQGGNSKSRYYLNPDNPHPISVDNVSSLTKEEIYDLLKDVDLKVYKFFNGVVHTKTKNPCKNSSFEWGEYVDNENNVVIPTNIKPKKGTKKNTKKRKIRLTTEVIKRTEGTEDFWNDYYSLKPDDFIHKYRKVYPYFFRSELEYNEGYAILDDDYYEITRKWVKRNTTLSTNGQKASQFIIQRIKDGEQRRYTMFRNGLLTRLMVKNSDTLTLEYMTYLLACERYYYYDNSDNVLNNKKLESIAKDVLKFEYDDIYFETRNPHHYKVDRNYAAMKGITTRALSNMCRAKIKYTEIDKIYNKDLKVKENLKLIKEAGIKCSERTLYNYRLDRGYIAEKKANKENSNKVEYKVVKDNKGNSVTVENNNNNSNNVIYKIDINTRVSNELKDIYEIVDNLIIDKETGEYFVMDKENVTLLNIGRITLQEAIEWYKEHNNSVNYWREQLKEKSKLEIIADMVMNNNSENMMNNIDDTNINSNKINDTSTSLSNIDYSKISQEELSIYHRENADELMEKLLSAPARYMVPKPSLLQQLEMSQEEYKAYKELEKVNANIICEQDPDDIPPLPEGYTVPKIPSFDELMAMQNNN